MRTHNGRDFFINKLLYKKSRKNKALILFDYSYYILMESILQDVLKLINDAMGYLRLFVIGGTAFFVAKDYALKMASSDDNQKASYDRKIKTTIIAGVSALVTTQFVSWILGYFK